MSQTREAECYLVVRPLGSYRLSFRTTKTAPHLAADEVAMRLTVKVPDAIFRRPALTASIEIPADQVSRPTIAAGVVDNIRAELQRQLGVSLTIAVVEPEEA